MVQSLKSKKHTSKLHAPGRNKGHIPIGSLSSSNDASYQHSWKSMYHLPPTGEITLEQFEEYSFQRLKLLKMIDTWKARNISVKALQDNIIEESNKIFDLRVPQDLDHCEPDWISHHILRLAFAKNEQLKQWFLTTECALFESRLMHASQDSYLDILQRNGIIAERVSVEEKRKLESPLSKMFTKYYFHLQYQQKENTENDGPVLVTHKSHSNMERFNVEDTLVFKVDFVSVLQLVGNRSVYIQNGKAYLFLHDLTSLIKQHYRANLAVALAKIQSLYPEYLKEEEKDRLLPFLRDVIPAASEGKSLFSSTASFMSTGEVKPEQIDALSKQSFPLCMRVLYKELKEKHHLKHYGRMQFGLFLKGIGLKLEDALQFWKDHFTADNAMTSDSFDKQYSYNIRHNYGKEGKKTNYSPYGCTKIINNPEYVCPFKVFKPEELRNEIRSYGGGSSFDEKEVQEVVDLAKDHHYQLACRRFFELSHGIQKKPNNLQLIDTEDDGVPFSHPNSYFSKSVKVLREKNSVGNINNAPASSSNQEPSTTDLNENSMQDEE
ncbi:hypothetical protein FDP41_011459 [Naegleria fowleri]|uniref:DNA primase large subunit C-terminal domain-containing protein n=1 Tax=Naegleria fowleri TaxID=5763 RepID=A0A6A5CB92_NAEFO|nr:uncharacterized protein FDP41_011459 [Naegleria fowleri]KAF0982529.1 hypothetical protein FDP41_011459 [Naegleria fowleri]